MRLQIPILVLLVIFLCMGCSGGKNNPINPSGDTGNTFTADDLRTLAVDQTIPENYWAVPLVVDGNVWASHYNENGTLHRAIGPGVDTNDPLQFVANHKDIFLVSPESLELLKDEVHGGIRYVIYQQTYNGVLVAKSRVDFRFSRNGKLVMIGSDVYPFLNVSTSSSISEYSAHQILVNDVSENPTPELEASRLVIYPIPETGTLAWRVDAGDWRYYIDAGSGAILERIHNVWNASFSASVQSSARMISPYDPEVTVPGSYNNVQYRSGSGGGSVTYGYGLGDINGNSTFVCTHSSAYERFRFISSCISTYQSSSVQSLVNDGHHTDFTWSDSNSVFAERNVFYHINKVHDYIKNIDKTFTGLDFQVSARPNGDAWCNAMASSNTVYFYKPADGCNHTGHIADVIAHEYGHVCTFNQYHVDVPTDVHEGCSDYFAGTYTDQSWVGRDIQGPGTKFRDSKNNVKWPAPECGGEGHCVGQVLAGAFWDTREILGREYTDYLFFFSRYGEPVTIPDFTPELIILDDDNDNPLDGTANYKIIQQTFYTNHSIPVPSAPNLPTTGVSLDVWPVAPPVKLNRVNGGNVFFKVRLTNLDPSTPHTFQAWAAIQVPWYGWYGPLLPPSIQKHQPVTLTLQGGQSLQLQLRQAIPANLPAGTYPYHIKIGQFINHTGDILVDDGWFDIVLE